MGAQASDLAGNIGAVAGPQFTINVRQLAATIQLEGYKGSPGADLPFRFVFSNDAGDILERRDVTLSFTGGVDRGTFLLTLIPEGATRVSVKETQHFLRRRTSIGGAGPDLTVSFTDALMLLGGDYNDDNFVDGTDFGQLLRDFTRTDRPRSDINCDGVVDIEDFDYISDHYFESGGLE